MNTCYWNWLKKVSVKILAKQKISMHTHTHTKFKFTKIGNVDNGKIFWSFVKDFFQGIIIVVHRMFFHSVPDDTPIWDYPKIK